MKNKKFLTGIVTASITAALSFALLACGDDSSSTAPEPSVSDGGSSAVEESSSSEMPTDTTCCKVKDSSSSEGKGLSSAGEPESSSSSKTEPLSSANAESSSSQGEKLVQVADDIFGLCRDTKSRITDGVECPEGASCQQPVVDWALPPIAYMSVDENPDSAVIIVDNVSLSCMAISGTASVIRQPSVRSAELTASGDTLYMNLEVDSSATQNECRCQSRVVFKIKADSAFLNATLLVVVRGDDWGDRMQILREMPPDEDSYPVKQDTVNLTELELNGYERGQCQNDDFAAKPVAKMAPSELPEATQITYMNGNTVLTLKNVIDYCGIDAKVSQKMVGDTLKLEYYNQLNMTRCICTFDKFEFLLEPENTAARYVQFKDVVYAVNVITYVVDPNWEN
ncbi:hypothetical protein [uncultured Fibrobacter sp.]|uniref:hypothetical protein n=1 Tax=uncultured Fibrobacter sp. TaxID=261512 RepID=UPI00261883EA|nr:hypothetical protein [uncultured Fibrobacter sp.]